VASPSAQRPPIRSDLLIDTAIALAVFAASLGLLAAGTEAQGGAGEFDLTGVLLTAVATLPLVARRRAPLLVFVVTAGASIALQALAQPAGPPLGATLALYWVAAGNESSRDRSGLTLLLVAVLLAAHATAAALGRGSFPDVEFLFAVVVWGAAWLAGERTRLRREQIAELEERALRAEREAERERRLAAAEERTRIARDLHDSAGHAINVVLVHAGLGRLEVEQDPDKARAAFETIEQVARETLGEIDELVRVLRSDAPEARTGAVEPPAGLAALDGLVERHRAAGLEVTTRVRGDRPTVPPAVDRGAYRILQEALINAARHGRGGADVEVTFNGTELELSVANAIRSERTGGTAGGGHGIIGMRERAALLGGHLEAGARNGRFEVHAHLPLARP
jgi:signal transduction histidine kinase